MSHVATPGVRDVPASRASVAPRSSQSARVLAWLAHTIPNLIVFSLLGAVAWWGHHSGWKLPSLHGDSASVRDDWCSEHLVPESQCVECNVELMPKPKPKGFCKLHGVAECVICNPELAQTKGPPTLPKYDTAAAIPLLKRRENNSLSTVHLSRVQFASDEAVEKAGLDVDIVGEQPMTEAIATNGEVSFDPTSVAHLSSKAAGTVVAVNKRIGDNVKAGEVIALVDATAVGQGKSQLLQSIVQVQLRKAHYDRLTGASAALPGRSILEAEAAAKQSEIDLVSARQALTNLGFTLPVDLAKQNAKAFAEELHYLDVPPEHRQSNTSNNLLPIRAPFAGVLLESGVVAGEVIDSSAKLFTIADASRLWLTLNVRQEDGAYIRPGQRVEFATDDGTQHAAGPINWISPTVDEKSRTLQVRVMLEEKSDALRDKAFGTGRIIIRQEAQAIVVPLAAVQATSDGNFVFVRDRSYFEPGGFKVFHVRQVRLGAKTDSHVELLAGALPGEIVATKGSNVLLAQLLRSNLGAGCGCHQE